jgi:hypothetical protein
MDVMLLFLGRGENKQTSYNKLYSEKAVPSKQEKRAQYNNIALFRISNYLKYNSVIASASNHLY